MTMHRILRIGFGWLARMRRFAQRADRSSAGVSEQADQDHRAVSARRHVGHSGARDRAEAHRFARSDDRRRKQAGRQRQPRRGLRFEEPARWLHAAARRYRRARDQPEPVQAFVRPGHRFFAGDDGGVLAAHPRRASVGAGEQHEGTDHARQVEARQAELRGVERRQRAASGRHRLRIESGRRLGLHSRTRAARRRSPTWRAARPT